ncbi:hypothetical protein BDA99DRAFT_146628 [Phascolomyces articulosus]|uniref:Uncharacterized protein n=1 Tax=Phascolomyces articulosus TaxID=60185 RepID=A0AAD5JUY0_9FUNG|nr:hypothetical protein BDA99DRAFT_146628 [Phascolomyces articulosus]
MNTQAIDRELNQKILSQINWRHGILPSGLVAKDPCFNFREMPIIKMFIIEPTSPQQQQNPAPIPSTTVKSTQSSHQTILVTQSDWTFNLVHSGAIYNLHDDATLQALSDCQLIFHQFEKPHQKTLHLLHFETVAWFRVDDILKCTKKFENALEDTLACWPEDPEKAWHRLCHNIWLVFGFLWPQKIMLGN